MKRKASKAERVRLISVKPGDVFGWSHGLLVVVTSVIGATARCRNDATGRRVTIQVRRLQREYPRCGEIVTLRARKRLAAIDRRAES